MPAAGPLLQKLVDSKGKIPQNELNWARRQLALVIAGEGGYANLQCALKMIEDNLATGEMTAEDMRAKATFLELDPRRVAILEAVDTMEKLVHSEELALPADRFTLARLYLHLKDLAKFREHMRVLLAKDPKNIHFISTYISAELEHGELSEAEIWLGTLERLYPGESVTAYHKADDYVRRNEPDLALAALDEFVERPNVAPEETLAAQRLGGGQPGNARRPPQRDPSDGGRGTLPAKGRGTVPPLCRPASAGLDPAGRLSCPPRTHPGSPRPHGREVDPLQQ